MKLFRRVDARFMDSVRISVHLKVGFLAVSMASLSQEESVIIKALVLPWKDIVEASLSDMG